MELERKFLINKLPYDVTRVKPENIKLGYITRNKEKEVRLRQKGRKYSLTVKFRVNSAREEDRIPLSRKDFHKLWPSTRGLRIEKERRSVEYDDIKLKIDSYAGTLSGLITGKIDIGGSEQPFGLTLPSYFKEELTFDNRFKSLNLSSIKEGGLDDILSVKNPGNYQLIGVLPYTAGKEVMLITTRSNGNWIFPKGQPMPGKTNEEVALLEAYEEAGIKGHITGHPILIPYEKSTGISSMILYPMEITRTCKDWDESSERKRKLVTPGEALKKISQPGLSAALGYLDFITP